MGSRPDSSVSRAVNIFARARQTHSGVQADCHGCATEDAIAGRARARLRHDAPAPEHCRTHGQSRARQERTLCQNMSSTGEVQTCRESARLCADSALWRGPTDYPRSSAAFSLPSDSAHDRATAGFGSVLPGIVAQPPFSTNLLWSHE